MTPVDPTQTTRWDGQSFSGLDRIGDVAYDAARACGATQYAALGAARVARQVAEREYWDSLTPKAPVDDSCPFCRDGFIAHWAHIDGGRCYRCDGKG